jgi:hypothetical protein
MDVVSEYLRRATDGAPPSRIDVDALIAADHRRRRFLIGGSAVTVAAASLAVVMVGHAFSSGTAPDRTVGGPAGSCVAPTPTWTEAPPVDPSKPPLMYPMDTVGPSPMYTEEPAEAAKARLGQAFAAALRSAMPGVPFTDWADPSCALPQVITFDPAFPYESAVVVTDVHGRGDIVIHLYAAAPERPACDDCVWKQDLPGGGLAYVQTDNPGRVDIWRPDGTGNMLLAADHRGDPARTVPPATREQLIAIGSYPALSIFPR